MSGITPRSRLVRKKKRGLSYQRQLRLLYRQDYRCYLCKASAFGNDPICFQVDHIRPVSKGGENTDWNVAAACVECNQKKGAKRLDIEAELVARTRRLIEATWDDPLPEDVELVSDVDGRGFRPIRDTDVDASTIVEPSMCWCGCHGDDNARFHDPPCCSCRAADLRMDEVSA